MSNRWRPYRALWLTIAAISMPGTMLLLLSAALTMYGRQPDLEAASRLVGYALTLAGAIIAGVVAWGKATPVWRHYTRMAPGDALTLWRQDIPTQRWEYLSPVDGRWLPLLPGGHLAPLGANDAHRLAAAHRAQLQQSQQQRRETPDQHANADNT